MASSLLHIFSAGSHRDRHGRVRTYTEADLRALAEGYDAETHEAPAVIGHPKANAPAYGWVKRLVAKGKKLYAELHEMTGEFTEWLERKHYKKRSVSLYLPEHSPNGGLYLRHVGFLGAQPPAIKGLEDYQFDEAMGEAVTVEFSATKNPSKDSPSGVARRMLDAIEEYFRSFADPEAALRTLQEETENDEPEPTNHSETNPRAMSKPDDTQAQDSPATDSPATDSPATDSQDTTDFAEREEQLTERERQLQEREEALSAQEAEARREECATFAEQLAGGGRILPRHQETVTEVLACLDGAEATLDFTEAGGEAETPVADALRALLGELPAQVDYSEAAAAENTRGDGAAGEEESVEYSAPAGYGEPDAERLALHHKVLAHQREHDVNYHEALQAVVAA